MRQQQATDVGFAYVGVSSSHEEGLGYQIRTRFSGAMYIGEPAGMGNAS